MVTHGSQLLYGHAGEEWKGWMLEISYHTVALLKDAERSKNSLREQPRRSRVPKVTGSLVGSLLEEHRRRREAAVLIFNEEQC